jgi:glucose-6-phosphate 1-dehydrogenase
VKATSPVDCTLFLFGCTGDLAVRKLFPALYRCLRDQGFSPATRIAAVARRAFSTTTFVDWLKEGMKDQLGKEWSDAEWAALAVRIDYVRFSPEDDSALISYASGLAAGAPATTIAYLSTPSSAYGGICAALGRAGLMTGHLRLVLEKPIGENRNTARAIQDMLAGYLPERQIYRIDHYLGKETVQNLFVLRFANPLFETLWNHQFIDHIQITIAETLGVEGRVEFYDATGALRDMVQNHLLQLLCILTMEPPSRMEPDRVRDEKLKVLRALRPLSPQCIVDRVVRGQYAGGYSLGIPVSAYQGEDERIADSTTETFVALKLWIDNLRWAGVPFYLRTGKRMPERSCKIVVQFKPIAHSLFTATTSQLTPNRLTITLQPDESIQLRLCGKRHGPGMDVRAMDLDLSAGDRKAGQKSDAYQRLLLDVVHGDQTLFVRQDELDAAWAWVDPILEAWGASAATPDPYPAGSWGPAASTLLLARDGNVWHESAQ